MIARITASLALVGAIATGIFTADTRYVHASEYQDFQWSIMKQQLRELRKELLADPDNPGLREDYADLLDLFCRKYQEDRECRQR